MDEKTNARTCNIQKVYNGNQLEFTVNWKTYNIRHCFHSKHCINIKATTSRANNPKSFLPWLSHDPFPLILSGISLYGSPWFYRLVGLPFYQPVKFKEQFLGQQESEDLT